MKYPLWLLNGYLRAVERPALARAKSPEVARKRFLRSARLNFVMPLRMILSERSFGHKDQPIRSLWVQHSDAAKPGIILYFHGGGYFFGQPETHAAMLARISQLTGLPAILPDYRKAPEHPFPAAPEDALAAYRALLDLGYAPDQIVLGGDSAGGGLALSLLQEILKSDLPKPGGVFVFSPWTDLTISSQSHLANARAEAVLPPERMAETAAGYLNGADPKAPAASPLYADFTGAPRIFIQVGSKEILLADSTDLAARLKAQGVAVDIEVFENTPHVWQLFQSRLKEADHALLALADWLAKGTPPGRAMPEASR